MSEALLYHQISFDTAHVPFSASPGHATFFDSESAAANASRVTDLHEKAIVRWLLGFHPARHIILQDLGVLADAFCKPEVVEPFYAPGAGDLDLLICHPCAPDQALALECKKVKVEIRNAGQDRLTKLKDVGHGVVQANRLYKGRFGFHQTYLCIITEVEASAQEPVNVPNRGLRSDTTPERGDTRTTTFRQIVEFPGRDDLYHRIGIVFIEVTQPSRLSIDTRANVRVCVYRRAERRDQSNAVTNRVLDLVR